MLTKMEAINELSKCDHAFLFPKGAEEMCEPFGFKPRCYKTVDSRSQHKGLYVPSVKEGDEVEGIDAMYLGMQLCDYLGVEYDDYFGRGSQLAECCARLKDKFRPKVKNPKVKA